MTSIIQVNSIKTAKMKFLSRHRAVVVSSSSFSARKKNQYIALENVPEIAQSDRYKCHLGVVMVVSIATHVTMLSAKQILHIYSQFRNSHFIVLSPFHPPATGFACSALLPWKIILQPQILFDSALTPL